MFLVQWWQHTILTELRCLPILQSKTERSGAEQSRAEQSRTEQNRTERNQYNIIFFSTTENYQQKRTFTTSLPNDESSMNLHL